MGRGGAGTVICPFCWTRGAHVLPENRSFIRCQQLAWWLLTLRHWPSLCSAMLIAVLR